MDFYTIEAAPMRGLPGMMEVAPWFLNTNSRDLMLRDGDFVAIWNPRTGLWSKDEFDVVDLVDDDVRKYVENTPGQKLMPRFCARERDGVWKRYRQWTKNMVDTDHPLDRMPVFADTPIRQEDHVSYRLPYSLEEGVPVNWRSSLILCMILRNARRSNGLLGRF